MSAPRPYRSRLRKEQAAHTRRKIRRAARKLFEQQGFADTTIAEIAEAAGVAVPTVYGIYGSKGGVVEAMLEDLEEPADQSGWEARISAESDPVSQLGLFVTWIRTLFEAGAPVVRAAMDARGDPEVAAMMARGDAKRLGGATALTAYWQECGALRPGLESLDAAHTVWLLTSAEQFLLAIDHLDWSPDNYERWLASLLRHVVLRPDAAVDK